MYRSWLTSTALVVASLLTAAGSASASPAEGAESVVEPATVMTSPDVDRQHGDYLELDAPADVPPALDEQCAAPLEEREGRWVCPDASALQSLKEDQGDDAALQGADAAAAAAGYCQEEGCWDKTSATQAEFSGAVQYGYGKTRLGTVNVFFKITLNGAQSVSKPIYFESTRGIRGATIEGERLYISKAKPDGAPVSPSTYAFYGPKSRGAGNTVTWLPNGYKSYEKTVSRATIVHNFVWSDPSSQYPGRWYFYVKSNSFKRQSSGAYYFESDSALPGRPAGSGYRS